MTPKELSEALFGTQPDDHVGRILADAHRVSNRMPTSADVLELAAALQRVVDKLRWLAGPTSGDGGRVG